MRKPDFPCQSASSHEPGVRRFAGCQGIDSTSGDAGAVAVPMRCFESLLDGPIRDEPEGPGR